MPVAAAAPAAATADISYQDLYRRWEQGNWRAHEIDFSQDREGWDSLTDHQRRGALWLYSQFFYGEDSVTDNLSPYLEAAPKEEQKYFLATQQVDEARHAVFFHRFFHEVLGGPEEIGEDLEWAYANTNWCYRQVFDRLDLMAEELRADRSLPKFAQAIAMYHMVVEATLAQPGQHYIEDYFAKAGQLPGFAEGMGNVSRDEQRHIGFGVKVLAELFAGPEAEECKAAVGELLREVMPFTLGVGYPPEGDRTYFSELGFEIEDLYGFGLRSVEAKWRAAGYPPEEMPPGVFPFDFSLPIEERTEKAVRLIEAGFVGEPDGPPDSSPETQRILFETVANSINHEAAGSRPLTLQWKFKDAAPWFMVIDNGSTRIESGQAEKADVTMRARWEDWIDASIRGSDPRKAMLRGKLRATGAPWKLLRMRRIFPPPRPKALVPDSNGSA